MAVGSPTLLIEVKTIAKEDDKTTEVYGRYLEKARLVNLIPTLTVVKARKENNSIMISIERCMLS